jgi:hypothetical protein
MIATRTRRRRPTTRSVAIGDLHEIFLVSSIGMILIIRLQLWATNYPKLGSGRLHFAHLLWGGLLMLVAIGILLSFVDRRLRVPAAILAGAGFGFFIDEVGKFVTSNNDYFFKPTGAIIYLTFIVVYFVLRFIRQRRGFSSAEYVSNALGVFSDGVAFDLHEDERDDALRLLDQAGEHPLVPELRALIERVPTVPGPAPSPARRFVAWAERGYDSVSGEMWFQRTIVAIFFAYAVVILSSILVVVFLIVRYDLPVNVLVPATVSDIAQQVSELVSFVLIFAGLTQVIGHHRVEGYRLLERAVLVELFIGQVFAFIDHSFAAVWAFLTCVALVISVRFMIRQELRLRHQGVQSPAPGDGIAKSRPLLGVSAHRLRRGSDPASSRASSMRAAIKLLIAIVVASCAMAAAVVWLSEHNVTLVGDVATLSDFAPFALFLLVILIGVTSMVIARVWVRTRRNRRVNSPARR